MSPALSKPTHTFPLQPSGSYSFPIQTFTLTDTPWSWESNLHCNSASHRVRSRVWFSAIFVQWSQEIRFLLGHTEEFWSHLYIFELGLESLSSVLFFHHCPVSLGATRQSYYIIAFKAVCQGTNPGSTLAMKYLSWVILPNSDEVYICVYFLLGMHWSDWLAFIGTYNNEKITDSW